MLNKRVNMRLVYQDTDQFGKSITKKKTYTNVISEATNGAIKKAAMAINSVSAQPYTHIEVVTTEVID